MIDALAFGKLTLSLRVAARGSGALHAVNGLFQSVDWPDRLSLATAEQDGIRTSSGGDVVDGFANLAWRATDAVRSMARSRPPLALILDKTLPVAAGLGGGSADAAAALAMAGQLLGVDRAAVAEIAPDLGSDVPFCLVGGSARVSGTGEVVDRRPAKRGFAFAIVVPPCEVATGEVYRRWDDLGGPQGRALPAAAVPPVLRDETIANDLLPAAVAVAGEIAEWRHELGARWGRPIALAGSGPSLFAFFVDRDEADAALDDVPVGARDTRSAEPVDFGWLLRRRGSDQAIDSSGRTVDRVW